MEWWQSMRPSRVVEKMTETLRQAQGDKFLMAGVLSCARQALLFMLVP